MKGIECKNLVPVDWVSAALRALVNRRRVSRRNLPSHRPPPAAARAHRPGVPNGGGKLLDPGRGIRRGTARRRVV